MLSGIRSRWTAYPDLLIPVSFACLALVYSSLAVHLSSFHAFWSPDSAARFAMIRSWLDHKRPVHLYYQSAGDDPSGQINPLAYFLFHSQRDFCAMYPPLFPILSGIAYRTLGFPGLTLVPMISGVGTSIATYGIAQRLCLRSRHLLPLITGVSTPLIIYAVVFWDHAVLMMLTAVAGYWMLVSLQHPHLRPAIIAGVVLGLGVWIHELMLALFVAVALASVPLITGGRRERLGMGLLLGFLPVVLVWVIFNWWVYGTVGGPHLSANMGGNIDDHPFGTKELLDLTQLFQRFMSQLIGTRLEDVPGELLPCYALFACLLFSYAALSWPGGPSRWMLSPLMLGIAVLALFSTLHVHLATGLFQATPLFIPSLAVPWYVGRKQYRETLTASTDSDLTPDEELTADFFSWISRATWLFILFVLIIPMLPGTDWGSRYLLPVLPFLTLMAAYAIEQQYRYAPRSWRWIIAPAVIILVLISFFCQCRGIIMVRRSIRYNQHLNELAHTVSSPPSGLPLVTDDISISAELTASHLPQPQFLVRSGNDRKLFLSILHRLKVQGFTYIGTGLGLTFIEGQYSSNSISVVKTSVQIFRANVKQEDGNDLEVVRFQLKPQR